MYSLCCFVCLMVTKLALSQTVLEYSIEENKPPTVIGNILNDTNLQLPQNKGIYFSILPIINGYNTLFEVDTTGDFKTVSAINRDAICPKKVTCTLNLDVQVNPITYFQIIKVNVIIDDVNDESPTFEKSLYTFSLSESSAIGTSVVLPIANDIDSLTNGVVSYQTSNLDAAFKFVSISQQNTEPKVVTTKALDRESIARYQFLLLSLDSSNPPHNGSTIIRINLVDINDSPPTFTKPVYEVTVDENRTINESILQVSATDKDSGANAQVYYYLSTVSIATYGNLFTIDEANGILRINGVLDFETIKEASLTIIARNKEPTSPSSQAKVIIHVRDLNDEVPIITVQTNPQGGKLSVLENATIGTFVGHITVHDPDSGVGGQVKCNLTKPINRGFSLVKIHTTDFKIITNMSFDREKLPDYEVTIMCVDMGDKPLSSTQNIPITIIDVNDNTPHFENSTYKAIITENSTPGQVLLTLRAHDRDIGNNGRIRYNIVPNTPNSKTALEHLEINPLKGEIKVKKAFDYERTKTLSFNVSATDHGLSPRSSQCTVWINVIDRDDEGPFFRKSVYEMTVFENNNISTSIGQVVAHDNDSNIYNSISYWFVVPSNYNGHGEMSLSDTDGNFTINSKTGVIYVNATLDRENVPNYTVNVMALGSGPVFRNSSCKVQVRVIDRNDNTPQMIFPNSINHTVSVPTVLTENDIVARIEASDLDANENALLSFHIVSGDDKGVLELDKNTGELVAAKDYKASLNDQFKLLIHVTDNGIPPRSNSSFLTVKFILHPITGEIELASNKNIVIAIAVLSGFIAVLLSIAIACLIVKRKQTGHNKKQTQLQTLSQTVPYRVPASRQGATQPVLEDYPLDLAKHKKPRDDLLNSVKGYENSGLDVELDEPVLQKLDLNELPPYEERQIVDGGGQSKDSSSEGSNADSGRGSHEETTSLPGLQRWDNVVLSNGMSPEKNNDRYKNIELNQPHADPEGRRVQVSQSFRTDSTSDPPELPPRTRRLSQSFRTFNENNDEPPPPPPPRLYNRNKKGLHFESPYTQSLGVLNHFDNNFHKFNNSDNNLTNTDFLYDSPKVLLYPPQCLPNLIEDTHFSQGMPQLGNEEFVDFIDASQFGFPDSRYTDPRKTGANNSFTFNYIGDDDMLLLDNEDVFIRDGALNSQLASRTMKYCSDV